MRATKELAIKLADICYNHLRIEAQPADNIDLIDDLERALEEAFAQHGVDECGW